MLKDALRQDYADLIQQQTWKMCLSSEKDRCTSLPDLTQSGQYLKKWSLPEKPTSVTYETSFKTPVFCKATYSNCHLYFAEVADAARFSLNGKFIGQHGRFYPDFEYAKNRPVHLSIPEGYLNPSGDNLLKIEAYYSRLSSAGIRKSPVMIAPQGLTREFESVAISQGIYLPLFSGFFLLFIALAVYIGRFEHRVFVSETRAVIHFLLAAGIFLIFFSGLPRSFFNVNVIGPMYYGSLYAMNWALFRASETLFHKWRSWKVWVDWSYRVICGGYLLLAIIGTFFPMHRGSPVYSLSNRLTDYFIPWATLPYVLGLVYAFQKMERYGVSLFLTFTTGLLIQVNDRVAHVQMSSAIGEVYLFKFFPVIFGLSLLAMLLFDSKKQSKVTLGGLREIKKAHQIFHDLRSPLGALSLGLDDPRVPQEIRHSWESNLQRIRSLITDWERGKGREHTYLPRLLHELIQTFEARSDFSEIEFRVSVSPDAHFHLVTISQVEVDRIFSNLFENSRRAMFGSSGVITVEVKSAKNQTLVKVIDNGEGIPEHALDSLLNENENYSLYDSSGIGLDYVKKVLRNRGGGFYIRSKLGRGTEVEVSFPHALEDHLCSTLEVSEATTRWVATPKNMQILAYAGLTSEKILEVSKITRDTIIENRNSLFILGEHDGFTGIDDLVSKNQIVALKPIKNSGDLFHPYSEVIIDPLAIPHLRVKTSERLLLEHRKSHQDFTRFGSV